MPRCSAGKLDLRADPPFPLNGMLSVRKVDAPRMFDILRAHPKLRAQDVRNDLACREVSARVLAVINKLDTEVAAATAAEGLQQLVLQPTAATQRKGTLCRRFKRLHTADDHFDPQHAHLKRLRVMPALTLSICDHSHLQAHNRLLCTSLA